MWNNVSKNKLLSLGGYNSKFRHREEEELRLRALKKDTKIFIQTCLYIII